MNSLAVPAHVRLLRSSISRARPPLARTFVLAVLATSIAVSGCTSPQQGPAATGLSASSNPSAAAAGPCVATPSQTEGPYFRDGMPQRSEISADSRTHTSDDGLRLWLRLNVLQSRNGSCTPV